jgi:hypothetical protein
MSWAQGPHNTHQPKNGRDEERAVITYLYGNFMYCMIVVYCIADGEKSRREGFYAPPSRHRTPLARETREREGRESGMARWRGVKPLTPTNSLGHRRDRGFLTKNGQAGDEKPLSALAPFLPHVAGSHGQGFLVWG